MVVRNRPRLNLVIVDTDAARWLLFVKVSAPVTNGGWLIVKDAVKVDRHPDAPFPAGLRSAKHDEEPSVVEIDEGTVHDVAALPGAEEVAAGVAEADAHAAEIGRAHV